MSFYLFYFINEKMWEAVFVVDNSRRFRLNRKNSFTFSGREYLYTFLGEYIDSVLCKFEKLFLLGCRVWILVDLF